MKPEYTKEQIAFITAARKKVTADVISRKEALAIATSIGQDRPIWLKKAPGRGMRILPKINDLSEPVVENIPAQIPLVKPEPMNSSPKIQIVSDSIVQQANGGSDLSFIPQKNPLYVKFGYHDDVKSIISSSMFYPIFITGLSGNGKTLMVEQICAETDRDFFRVNITAETDEDDLFGGFRLVNGETIWFDGPVIRAMKLGAVLLLDEVDLATAKVMCLQPVLEGKGVFLKKINTFVKPTAGFTVIATANTKGRGSDDGKFIGTNILNEAFLERFPITIEQEYPSIVVEKKILKKLFESHNITNDTFISNLVNWSEQVRKLFFESGIDEIISTRRLVHIANAFAIFKNEEKAIDYCINRFDNETKMAFKSLYQKMVEPQSSTEAKPADPENVAVW